MFYTVCSENTKVTQLTQRCLVQLNFSRQTSKSINVIKGLAGTVLT